MEPNTHLAISAKLCGTPRVLREGSAEVELTASEDMRADARGLVHGGFVFGLADHAAMLAINAPNVVLGSAETRFLAPVSVGEQLLAIARVSAHEGKKFHVEVHVSRGLDRVFEGSFVCFVPGKHVLEPRAGSAS
jgi:acyl-coenzyme A thioesterase PaaI-like protein